VDWTLEIIGIFIRPSFLAGFFTCSTALRLIAIRLLPGIAIVRNEDIFTADALTISFAIHYPGTSRKIMNFTM
jgi:hypothetical protein